MILIISNKKDFTVDHVVKILNNSKIPFFRFNTEDFPINISSSISISSNYLECLDISKKNSSLKISEISSVWYRRPLEPDLSLLDMKKEDIFFATRESHEYLQNIYSFLDDKLWVNNVFILKKVERKTYQLKIANYIGFNTPDTLVSNNPIDCKNFFNFFKGDIIAKPISNGAYGILEDKAIFANDLSTLEQIPNFDSVSISPVILQNKINKKFDVRTIVFGKDIFSYAIKSETKYFDWRKIEQDKLKYELIKTPDNIATKIYFFMKKLSLNFGAFDFSIDTNENWFFLEVNPNGQWAWIEYIVKNNDMTNSLIKLLMSKDV